MTIEKTLIYANNAYVQGAGIYLYSSQATMINNTIASNHQPSVNPISRGAGIWAAGGSSPAANGYNNIVYFNEACTNDDVYGNINFTYSCVATSLTGTGNITSNPQFVNEPYYQYNLQSTSPCIDTGNPSSPLDPDGTRADMGALYYHQASTQILSVSPSSLTFNAEIGGSNPSNQTFQVSNGGTVPFSYTISESISWLTVSPMSGGPVPPAVTETVSVNISGLSAGTYQGDITVTAAGASGSPATVHVTLVILGGPELTTSPANLTFGAEVGGSNPPSQTFQVSNTGGGTLSYTVSESTSWLTVSPLSGGPVPPTATETVSVNISGLSLGTYTGNIIVTASGASGSPDTVRVTLNITQTPILLVSPSSLTFNATYGGSNPSNQVFQIANAGSGTFTFNVSENTSWLSVTPLSGGPVPPNASETVSVNISGLAAGSYQGNITVVAPGAQGSPATVPVMLVISQNPVLSVSPASLTFQGEVGGSNPSNQTFQISNTGAGTFSYTISESISWLTVSPLSGGPVPPTATETVSVNIAGLSQGSYEGDIIISAAGAQGSPDTVHVTLNLSQNPVLSVTPGTLSFNAEIGGSNPSNQTFQISNTGTGTFSYAVSESISWLSVSPTSGGPVPPTATETVSVNIAGLSAGTYQGNIIIAASGAQGSPDTVLATLTITQHPILSVSPAALSFNAEIGGSNPSNQIFQISNTGTGTFSYTVSESISWLSVTPLSGGPVPPTRTETVSVNIAGLAVGTYTGNIMITASGVQGSPDTVQVSLTITQNPILSVSPANLTFYAELGGSNPANQSFQISNAGTGSFSYTLSESVAWLAVTPSNGSVPPNATETVSVDISGLAAATYQGDIIVSASGVSGSPDTVHVALTVTQDPILQLLPTSLEFQAELGGSNPANQTFRIINAGTGSFPFTITESISWLSVSPTSGGSVPPNANITVAVNASGLVAGIYEGDITVTATGAQGSPGNVHATLTVTQHPVLSVSPGALTFNAEVGGGNPANQAFQIQNTGTGILEYTISESISWLSVSPMFGGPVPPSANETVSVDISGLTAGTYDGNIIITAEGAEGSPDTVQVTLTVIQNPMLSVSPASLSFNAALGGGNPSNQTFQVSNTGTGTFSYTISEGVSWLSVSPMSGGPVPPTATETVSVNISGLTAGTYQGNIIVTAAGVQNSPDTVHVTLTVTQNPMLSVSPASLSFNAALGGGNPSNQTFQVSNTGTGTFSYTISESISWLSVSPMSGGPVPPTSTETVSVNISGLTAGTYQGIIIVTAAGVQNSPDTVQVSLIVAQNPILSVSPASLSFNAQLGGGNPSNQTFLISNSGTGTFSYAISESVTWLSVSPMNGGPVPPSAITTVSVSITGLAAGTYEGDIIITASGVQNSPDTLHVTLDIYQDPILLLWPYALNFNAEIGGDNPPDQTFLIVNMGTGTLDFSIAETESWLIVTPMHGGPVPPEDTITVSVDISGLTIGTYEGDIIVTAPYAQGSPDTVHVQLTVWQQPQLALSRDDMIFTSVAGGSNPPDQSFIIDNTGSGTFEYTISESISWLSVSPETGGPVPPAADIAVSVDISGLSPGDYSGSLVVSALGAQGSPDTIDVYLNVCSAPVLVVEPTSLVFHATEGGANPSPQIINISNGGGGSFDFQIICDIAWIQLAMESGGPVPPAIDDTVSIVNITGMPPGIYEYDIIITADGAMESPQNVHVVLDISSTGLRRLDGTEIPHEFSLKPPYPNPFNPSTNLTFSVPVPGIVQLLVFDIQGRVVGKIMEGWCPSGVFQTTFDATRLASGMYFCRMIAPGYSSVQKMTLVK